MEPPEPESSKTKLINYAACVSWYCTTREIVVSESGSLCWLRFSAHHAINQQFDRWSLPLEYLWEKYSRRVHGNGKFPMIAVFHVVARKTVWRSMGTWDECLCVEVRCRGDNKMRKTSAGSSRRVCGESINFFCFPIRHSIDGDGGLALRCKLNFRDGETWDESSAAVNWRNKLIAGWVIESLAATCSLCQLYDISGLKCTAFWSATIRRQGRAQEVCMTALLSFPEKFNTWWAIIVEFLSSF